MPSTYFDSHLFHLVSSKYDPGIAIDLRAAKDLQAGPYVLAFDLTTSWKGMGDIFYTVDREAILPKGERIEFSIDGSDAAQNVRIELPTDARVQQLRIDVADGAGKATIKKLRLLDAKGEILKDWTSGKLR